MLFSFAVAQAFAKCMRFDELSAFIGAELREAQFGMSKADSELFQQIRAFKNGDPNCETLTTIKPIYGFTRGPRAWMNNLHQVFVQKLSCMHLFIEFEAQCIREVPTGPPKVRSNLNALDRATVHIKEQQETSTRRTINVPTYKGRKGIVKT